MSGLPRTGLIDVYVNGAALSDAIARALPAGCELPAAPPTLEYRSASRRGRGRRPAVAARRCGRRRPTPSAGTSRSLLDGCRPTCSILGAPSFHGSPELDGAARLRRRRGAFLPDIEQQLGVNARGVLELFAGEVALYVRPGARHPRGDSLARRGRGAASRRWRPRRASRAGSAATSRPRRRSMTSTAHARTLGPGVRSLWRRSTAACSSSRRAGRRSRDFRGDGDKLVDDERFRRRRTRGGSASGRRRCSSTSTSRTLSRSPRGSPGLPARALPPRCART